MYHISSDKYCASNKRLLTFSCIIKIYHQVWPRQKSYIIQWSKQGFMRINITLFSEKRHGALIRAGAINRSFMVWSFFFFFQAPSKDAVSKTCQEAFLYSGRRNIPESVLSQVAKLFEVDQKGARKVVSDSIWMRLSYTVDPQWLEHWCLVYYSCFKLVLESLGKFHSCRFRII